MFTVTGTQHVLAVNNLDAAERYFVDLLGFEIRFRVDGWCFINLQDFHVMLGHCPDEVPAADTNNHSYFAYVNCTGIDNLYRQYQEKGVRFTQPLADKPWGIREFGVITPEGHRIMFGEPVASGAG